MPKVPEFWCSFFFKHKITNFRELLLYYRKKFKQLCIVLSDNVIWIGDKAFANCNKLSSITIPSKVRYIGDDLFEYCFSLKTILMEPVKPPSTKTLFGSTKIYPIIYIPIQNLEFYKVGNHSYAVLYKDLIKPQP